ncbi:uncharacterized protein LOC121402946 [Xenopus laevis]|uniref:Uncharacterized protein LOC121402946 n=1 Tax=Xenopus laevis TaxID=8355 RepID=A0A8J1MY14_XENLA|nr:uncharacterized protein LOC121402946 [Xenopus laevis]
MPDQEIISSHSSEKDGKCYSLVCDSNCVKRTSEITCPPVTPPTTTPHKRKCVCRHEGRVYVPDQEIESSHSREKDGKCYSLVCDSNCEKRTSEITCPPVRQRTTTPHERKCLCHHDGRVYMPDQEIISSHSSEKDGKCYSLVCDSNCVKRTSEITCPPVTPPTTTPHKRKCVCRHEGRVYVPDQEIESSHSREKDGKCYSLVCDSNCEKRTSEITCPPVRQRTTTPHERKCLCHHDGRVYMPDQEIISSHSSEKDGKCYSLVCDSNCVKRTSEITCPPVTPPTTTPHKRKCVCRHEGRVYVPDQEIESSHSREKDGKCYSLVCDSNCEKRTSEITCPPVRQRTTTPHERKCLCHHDGRVYMPDQEIISSHSSEKDGKCYSLVCDSNCVKRTSEITCPPVTPPSKYLQLQEAL